MTVSHSRRASLRKLAKLLSVVSLATMAGVCQAAGVKGQQRIVIYGASGKIGGLVVSEALARGHRVVAVSREPKKLKFMGSRFEAVKGDVTDIESFRKITRRADSIVISVVGNGAGNRPENSTHAVAARTAVAALTGQRNAPYVVQVGGASTMIGDRAAIMASPVVPAVEGTELYGVVFGHLEALSAYRGSNINWAFIAPPGIIDGWTPGGITALARSGKYRTSTTGLVRDASGKNAINVADLAVAIVDEVEGRHFVRQQFTVGY
jgi:putative NADH-flavin reductase